MLTQYASWRWTLLINVPIAILAAVFATRLVTREPRSEAAGLRRRGSRHRHGRAALPRLRVHPGRVRRLGVAASPSRCIGSWPPCCSPSFVLIERRSQSPATAAARRARPQPWRLVHRLAARRDRDVRDVPLPHLLLPGNARILGGPDRLCLLAVLPRDHRRAPTLSSRSCPRSGPKVADGVRVRLAAFGLFLFTGIGVHTSYLAHLLPAEIIVSFGMGTAFVPL